MTTTLTHMAWRIAPPWLVRTVGKAYLALFGQTLDSSIPGAFTQTGLLDKAKQAIYARLPKKCQPDALPYLAADRLLVQGPAEPAAAFGQRLSLAFDSWQHAGSARAVMEQSVAYLQAQTAQPPGDWPVSSVVGVNNSTIPRTARWWWYRSGDDTTKAPATYRATPTNWSWDNAFRSFWRCWLTLYFALTDTTLTGTTASVTASAGGLITITGLTGLSSSNLYDWIAISSSASNNGTWQIVNIISATSVQAANSAGVAPDAANGAIHWLVRTYKSIKPAPCWGAPGVVWGDPTISVGFITPAGTWSAMRAILRTWKSGSAWYQWVLVSFSGQTGVAGSEFSPWSSQGSGNPDGTWGDWGKTVNGVVVPARATDARYVDGSAFWNPAVASVPLTSG